MYISKFAFVIVALIGMMVLSGCGVFKERELRPCPRIVRIGDASEIVQYRGGKGRDIIDVAFRAEIGDMTLTCEYDDNRVEATLRFEILATRGPAAEGNHASFPFFVAIVGRRNQVLEKRIFESEIVFPAGRRRSGVYELLGQNIPVPEGARADIYRIMVGFQLTREQYKTRLKNR